MKNFGTRQNGEGRKDKIERTRQGGQKKYRWEGREVKDKTGRTIGRKNKRQEGHKAGRTKGRKDKK